MYYIKNSGTVRLRVHIVCVCVCVCVSSRRKDGGLTGENFILFAVEYTICHKTWTEAQLIQSEPSKMLKALPGRDFEICMVL